MNKRDLRKLLAPTLALVLLLQLVLLTGCAQPVEEIPPVLLEPIGIATDLTPVQRGDVEQYEIYNSSVIPKITQLYFPVDGYLETQPITYGDPVTKGQLLCTLDSHETQIALDDLNRQISYTNQKNEVDLRKLEVDLELLQIQMRTNYPDPVPADNEEGQKLVLELRRQQEGIDSLKKAQKLEMQTQLDQKKVYEDKIEQCRIVSPVDGKFVGYMQSGANYVKALNTVAVISQPDEMLISGDFITDGTLKSAVDMYALVDGKRVEIEYMPYDEEEYISLSLSGQKMDTQFSFDPAQSELEVGDYVTIVIVTKAAKDTLWIPINALYTTGQNNYVYRDVDGSRERVDIKTGVKTTTQVEVTEGLAEGELVYVKK